MRRRGQAPGRAGQEPSASGGSSGSTTRTSTPPAFRSPTPSTGNARRPDGGLAAPQTPRTATLLARARRPRHRQNQRPERGPAAARASGISVPAGLVRKPDAFGGILANPTVGSCRVQNHRRHQIDPPDRPGREALTTKVPDPCRDVRARNPCEGPGAPLRQNLRGSDLAVARGRRRLQVPETAQPYLCESGNASLPAAGST